MWFKRLILTLLLIGFSLAASFQLAERALPTLSLENALIIAAVVMVVFAIAMRLMVIAAIAGFFLSLLLLATIVLASHFFFLEQEQDRWFANQNEAPQMAEDASKRNQYMQSIGLDSSANPVLDSLFHSRYQAESALKSQQLTSNQVAPPVPEVTASYVWQQWFYQLLTLVGATLMSIVFGCRSNKT